MVPTIEVINKRPRLERIAKCGILNLLKSTPEHTRNIQKLAFLLTSAEIQMVTKLFGAIPLIQRRDGKNVLQGRLVLQYRLHSNQSSQHVLLQSQLRTQYTTLDQKNAQELNALVIEEDKPRLDLERLAKDGMLNLLTSIPELPRDSQELASGVMFAETQIMLRLFGVTLLIQRRDGNTVIQSVGKSQKFLNHIQSHQYLETDAEHSKECSAMVPTTEVNNSLPRVEKCA